MLRHLFARALRCSCAAALGAACLVATPASAEVAGSTRVARLVGGGVSTIFATHAPGRPDELFILQQSGRIEILNLTTGAFNVRPFLDIESAVDDASNEQGLLGLAFDPDYEQNGYFYVNYTRDPGPGRDRTRIERYQATNPMTAATVSAATARPVLEFEQDFNNHNGGWIGFSPVDELLYIATGDGGSGDDPNNRAQQLNTRLGKMLRVDPRGDDFPTDPIENYRVPADNPFANDGNPATLDSIWSYGLRNPYRSSFDRETGDLWIGDVGQGAREEIDMIGPEQAGANFGWRLREGDIATPGSVGGPIPPDYVGPVYDYLSNGAGLFGGNSVVGGYVYRGPDPDLQGEYFFGDSFPSQLWSFDPEDPDGTVRNLDSVINPLGAIGTPVSFGEDAAGNLYVVDRDGDIFRITTHAPGDIDNDGDVDPTDYDLWADTLGSTTSLGADANANGVIDAGDYTVWRDGFAAASTSLPEPSGLVALLSAAWISSGVTVAVRRRPPVA